MAPKRSSTRASAAPTPARYSNRTTRARATPFLEGPTPPTAQRGYLANSYGDEDRQPVPSGVADINAAKGFAAEMQAKVNRAQEQRAALASRALSKSISESQSQSPHDEQMRRSGTRQRHQEESEEESEEETEIKSSPRQSIERRSQPRSISTTRSEQDDVDETLPSGGLGPIREFDLDHEAGLEVPARLPGLWKIPEILGVKAEDLMWAAIYTVPAVLLTMLSIAYGPLAFAYLISSLCALKDMIHMPSFSTPDISVNWPSLRSNHTTTITVGSAAQTATTTSVVYKYRGADSETMEEVAKMRNDMRSMREQVAKLETQIKAPHRINFFSPNLGAYISQRYTSPTKKQGSSLWTRTYFTFFKEFVPLPPIAALQPWTENGDCWCAAPTTGGRGRLSIGINLGKDVYPEDFIVEHISKSDALDITSAPKRLDLWVQLAPGFLYKDVPKEWQDNGKGCESPPPKEKGETWICMGQAVYDISNDISAQSRSLHGYQKFPPFKVNKAVVRVLENYGKEYTCLYRIKLAGRVDQYEDATYG